jgi:hypothetical protein
MPIVMPAIRSVILYLHRMETETETQPTKQDEEGRNGTTSKVVSVRVGRLRSDAEDPVLIT